MSLLSKPFCAIAREWAVFVETVRSPECSELLLWCFPALILGGIARGALGFHFPYGYFQGDSPDFLVTAERFVTSHALVIHGKKAFLAPIFYALPFLVHIPALLIVPAIQHLAGLAATVAAGGIVRCWFRAWRWFIIPLTLLYTLNPALLWYEHALLAECLYLFCVTAVALAGSLLVLKPTLRRFIWLIVALFFTAGSRPEGKLFLAFGLGVTFLVYLGDWKLWLRRMAVMLACSAVIWMCSRSTQAGLLLYATVLPLAPEVSHAAPGVDPFVRQLRENAITGGETIRTRLNKAEKMTNDAIRSYLQSIGKDNDDAHVNAVAQKLAIEAMRREPHVLPAIAANKFLMTCRQDPHGGFTDTSGGFTPFWIYDKQIEAYGGKAGNTVSPLMKGLTGYEIRSDLALAEFVHEKYRPLAFDWFSPWQSLWTRLTVGLQWHSHGADKRFIPGWPALWLVAMAGMVGSLIPRDRLWRFHWPWLAAIGGVWLAVMLTGVVNPRYRFVFEPFCIFYAFLLLDLLWSMAKSVRRVS